MMTTNFNNWDFNLQNITARCHQLSGTWERNRFSTEAEASGKVEVLTSKIKRSRQYLKPCIQFIWTSFFVPRLQQTWHIFFIQIWGGETRKYNKTEPKFKVEKIIWSAKITTQNKLTDRHTRFWILNDWKRP